MRNVTSPVVLQNNVQAVKQTSRFQIAPAIVSGDSVSVEIGSGAVTQAFDTDESATVSAFVTQLDNLSMVDASYDSGTRTVTLSSQVAGDSFHVGEVSVASAGFSGSVSTLAAPETRASATVDVLAVPAGKMVLALGDCSVTVSGSVSIDASSSDCSDGAAEIDSAAIASTDMLAQLLRGISGYSYESGNALAVSGTGSQIVLTRATAQSGTLAIPVSATNEDLSPNLDFSWTNGPAVEAVAESQSIVLPRELVSGDALSVTLDGATYVQNVTSNPSADFANFVSNLDGLSAFAVNGDYGTRTITVVSTNAGTSFALLQGALSYAAPSSTVASAVAAVAQKDAFTLPHLPVAGETVTVTVQGTGVGIASSVADASCTEGGVPAKDIAIWGSSGNPQIWSACNKGATNPIPYANMKFDGSTNDVDVSTAQYSGGIYQWGNNADVRSAGTWSNTANTNDDAWGNTTNTNAARQ